MYVHILYVHLLYVHLLYVHLLYVHVLYVLVLYVYVLYINVAGNYILECGQYWQEEKESIGKVVSSPAAEPTLICIW